jgi:lipoprotein-releasing system permease protein
LYKLLLCWRYLLTRYLALVCIISVMLGVATLIVVNSVMAGFSTKLRDRLHGLLSDVVIEAHDNTGMTHYDELMAAIHADPYLDSQIEAMTPTLEIFAILQFNFIPPDSRDSGRPLRGFDDDGNLRPEFPFHDGTPIMRPVHLIGIDPEGRARVGGFGEHLLLAKDKAHPTFDLSKEGFENYLRRHPYHGMQASPKIKPILPSPTPEPDPPQWAEKTESLPEKIILGYALAHYRDPKSTPEHPLPDVRALVPGDEVVITTVSGTKLKPVDARFVVCDYIKTEMSEYDSNYVFVPLEYLQRLRSMEGRATSIQIRLKDERNSKEVVTYLRDKICAPRGVYVETWQDKQGPLLSAIAVEKGLLNVLLFMIILVAGFGILAIFSMIVVEKTRDIGILKALGASNGGVMKIFLSYGLLLGTVGALCGTGLGLTITIYINEIEHFLTRMTGQEIFSRNTYYFDKIPTDIQPLSVLLVNVGAIVIAVMFSVLPALRAAMLHPVRALRYE